jgi:hypothetical protein
VDAVGHTSLSQRAYLWVAHLATGGVVSHERAASAHRLVERLTAPVPVIARGHPRRGIEVHRSAWLPPEQIARQGGLPVTSVARTIADLDGQQQRRAPREATYRRVLDHAQLPLLLTRHPARARLREALERHAPTAGASFRSPLEHGAAPLIDRRRDRTLLARTGIRTVRFTDQGSYAELAQTFGALLIL